MVGLADGFAAWVLRSSLHGTLLIGAVLVAQYLFRTRLAPQWRQGLWLLVLIRLGMPWLPESSFSVAALVPAPASPAFLTDRGSTDTTAPVSPTGGKALGVQVPPVADSARRVVKRRTSHAPWIWLTGAGVLSAWLLAQTFLTLVRFRARRPVTDPRTLELLEDCKEELGVRTYLPVVEMPGVRGPVLFGWIRPRLLLPAGAIETLSCDQLRHVFLHELAHVKRHDIVVNWAMTLVRILHWFNPIVWLALRRAHSDMELACDAAAMSHMREHEPQEYGRTIVRLLETWAPRRRVPPLAALAEDVSQMKRRIEMIASFRKGQSRPVLLPASLMVLLGVPFLANSQVDPDSRTHEQARTQIAPEDPGAGSPGLRQAAAALTSPGPAAPTPGNAPDTDKAPIDAALLAAEQWYSLKDAAIQSGDFTPCWRQSHWSVQRLVSQEVWQTLWQTRTEAAARDGFHRVVARETRSIDYLPGGVPGLGDAVAVTYQAMFDNGERVLLRDFFLRDDAGQWRWARNESDRSPNGLTDLTASPIASAGPTIPAAQGRAVEHPIDAAIHAADHWLALVNSGACDQSKQAMHSAVKGQSSPELWRIRCERRTAEIRRAGDISDQILLTADYGPHHRIMLTYRFTLQRGELTSKVVLDKDQDGLWRVVSVDDNLQR